MTTNNALVAENISIYPVSSRKQMKQFIQLPWHIYQDDPNWVPHLNLERRAHYSSLNPFFKHAEWQAWIACRNGQPIGRICAQVDFEHREYMKVKSGHFGLLEAENDAELFQKLIETAEQWLKARETTHVTGPFAFSINQECGVLVDGFDTPPVVMMPHSRPWYDQYLQEQGYQTAANLIAYWVNLDFPLSRAMKALFSRYKESVKIRPLRRAEFNQELEILRDIFNDAWSENWGFIPFNKAEFSDLGNSLRFLVPDEFIQIAEKDGEPMAFIVMLPNLNEILKDLNGKTFPLGWYRLLKWEKDNSIKTGRVPLMGVRKKYQKSRIGTSAAFLIINELRHAAKRKGLEAAELSWILEQNTGMRNMLESIAGEKYKQYRVYEKHLS